MIPEAKATKLVEIYCLIDNSYENQLQYCCQRFSNNARSKLTDVEVMTIYLFCIHHEQRFKVKHIHAFALNYLRDWFPELGSYAAFNNRLNRLSEAFKQLLSLLVKDSLPDDCSPESSLLDSMPIITCSGKREPKVAIELVDKGRCSSKSMYYHGLKLHALAFFQKSKLPHPEELLITLASVNDLPVFKQAWSNIHHRCFFGDKIYHNKMFFAELEKEKGSIMLTPVKAVKGQTQWEKQWNKAADKLFSGAVSSVRQPIESLFNWLIEKTDFQRAGKVRSAKGLLVHVFGKMAAAFIHLPF